MSYISKIRDIEAEVVKLIQDEIRRKKLVKTGNLLNSISAKASIKSNGNFSLQVSGADYYSILDKEHNITDDAFDSPGYNIVAKLIAEAFSLYFIEQLD